MTERTGQVNDGLNDGRRTGDRGSETLQVVRAWGLARRHGHHWATSATKYSLAYGREILKLGLDFRPDTWRHESLLESIRARVAARTPLADPSFSVPPATVEECEALSALPAGPCGGIRFAVDVDGVVRHTTGSGRLRWAVHPDGSVALEVHRPSGLVLSAWVPPGAAELRVVFENQHSGPQRIPASARDGAAIVVHRGEIHERHCEALLDALHAIGATSRDRIGYVPDGVEE